MQCRSAILRHSGLPKPYAQSRPLSIETVTVGEPGLGEVLVRIRAAGVCHSDLSGINGDRPRTMPVALGHEAAGEVVRCGEGVSDLSPGQPVVMSFVPQCGHCGMCAEGRGALCLPGNASNAAGTLLGGARHFKCEDETLFHHCGVSAFSEYSIISRRSIVPISNDISLTHAALFGCAVMTGVGTVLNTCAVRPGETVAILGLGGVGLAGLLGAVAAGASRIIAIDLLQSKLDLAMTLGATDAFRADQPDVIEAIRAATGGGVHHAVELAGSTRAFELAYAITRRGGTTASAGLPPPDAKIALSAVQIVAEERVVKGGYMGSCVPSRDIPRYIDLFKRGRLPVDKLLSSTGPLDGINEAFDRLDRGEVIRHVIEM
jgi:alcohol dehydrogenase